jgi:AAA15 family ATPase/GTPase
LRLAFVGVLGHEIQEHETEARVEREPVEAALRDVVGDRLTVNDDLETVRVEHQTNVGTFSLRLAEESSGTRTWIGLLGPVLSTLRSGAVLCVDELDARLHPYLVDALVELFQSPEVNVHGAQLVFSTHEASLLGRSSRTELFRDQVWFTEKDHHTGATRLFPMTEFQVRDSLENLEKRYLVGRYGAVPFFDDDLRGEIVAEIKRGSRVATEQATGTGGAGADGQDAA